MTETPATDAQLRRIFALFGQAGVTERDERIACFQRVLHGGVSSSTELTADEASRLIEELEVEVLLSDPRRMFETAQATKKLRRGDLLDALSGRRRAAQASGSGGFDGGARRTQPAEPESHAQTLTRVLRTGEADAGGSF